MARTAGMSRHIFDLQRHLADIYLALNNLDASRRALHEALTIAEELGSYPQKVKTLFSTIAYYHRLGWNNQAAIWAGFLIGDIEIDEELSEPVCMQLEATPGSEEYYRVLEQGKMLSRHDIIPETLTLLG